MSKLDFGLVVQVCHGVTRDGVGAALARQKATGERIGEALCALGLLSKEQRDDALTRLDKLRGKAGAKAAVAEADAFVAAARSALCEVRNA